jgi:hypothetical protein
MKGILFGGCSFTWGQGLYFYSDLNNLPYGTQKYGFDYKNINESMLRYKNVVRFPRLVAQHFDTFEVVREDIGKLYGNGGSEDETFSYFDYLFNVEKKFKYMDFDYIVIQLSNLWRNNFTFELDGIQYQTKIMELFLYDHIEKDLILTDELNRYCELNNYTLDDIKSILLTQQFKRLKEKIIFYKKRGIKVKVVSWLNDMVQLIKNDDILNDVHIPIIYENNIFNEIQHLMDFDKNLEIEYDLKHNWNINCQDKHPSLKCHKIIANSIIENIKKEL